MLRWRQGRLSKMNGKTSAKMLLGAAIGFLAGYAIGAVLRSLGVGVILSSPPASAVVFGLVGLLISRHLGARAATPIAMSHLSAIETVEQYQDKVVNVRKPIVIEFYADWCAACKRVGPMVNELAKEYGDRVYFYRVDIDKSGELAKQNNVDGVPTAIFYARGGEVKRIVGATWTEELRRELDSLLGGRSQI